MAIHIANIDNIVLIEYIGVIRLRDLEQERLHLMHHLAVQSCYVIYDLSEVMYTDESRLLIRNHYDTYNYIGHPNVVANFFVLPEGISHPRASAIISRCKKHFSSDRSFICHTREEAQAVTVDHQRDGRMNHYAIIKLSDADNQVFG